MRHNLHYLDVLAIIDNDSIDGTREIIVELQKGRTSSNTVRRSDGCALSIRKNDSPLS